MYFSMMHVSTLSIGMILEIHLYSPGKERPQQCLKASLPYFLPVCSPAPLQGSDVSFAPLAEQLRLHDGQSIGSVQASTKTFRMSVISSAVPPLALRNISAASWKSFWSLSLTTVQRNVIYRYILGYIPHRRFLHFIMPQVSESPMCPVCLSTEDSPSHLLFHCPSKEKM
ncbi:unnamed protein product [Mucor fragilis]